MVLKCDRCGSHSNGTTCRICGRLIPVEKDLDTVEEKSLSTAPGLAKTDNENPIQRYPADSEEPDKVVIIIISALFGPFGAIPANIAAKKAATKGLPTKPYWKVFWVTWLISSVVLIIAQIIFWTIIFGSFNSSLNTISPANNAGSSRVVVDCSNPTTIIDVDGTICASNNATQTSWIPVHYMDYGGGNAGNSKLAWKWADKGSYSCDNQGQACQALYAISLNGCKNGISVDLDLHNSSGVSIGHAFATSPPEQPMEIVQLIISSSVQQWTNSALASLSCQ